MVVEETCISAGRSGVQLDSSADFNHRCVLDTAAAIASGCAAQLQHIGNNNARAEFKMMHTPAHYRLDVEGYLPHQHN